MEQINWTNFLNAERIRDTRRDQNKALDPRNEFESDFGRIIFSPATRRMHDKTQVFPLTSDDNIHSRLTHSMEVMAIGHSLGLRVCENEEFAKRVKKDQEYLHREVPVILKNACLVHDIGNPPFGHFGEEVIAKYFERRFENNELCENLTKEQREDFTWFDGNAQGLRVLTKLQVLDDTAGLNLTFATLGAYCKYPNFGDKIEGGYIGASKRGVFQSEIGHMNRIAETCKLPQMEGYYARHPLAFLMEAADSICYLTMDVEDGINKGWYSYELVRDYLKDKVKNDSLHTLFDKLDDIKGEGSTATKVVRMRIFLISELVSLAVNKFVDNLDEICSGQYNQELIYDDVHGIANALHSFCIDHIFRQREIQQLELTGHAVLSGLLDYYTHFIFDGSKGYKKRAIGLISNSTIRVALFENGVSSFDELNDYYKLRVIVDFITGMTDQFALNHYQKLSGQKIV